jgi:hypothetical protein
MKEAKCTILRPPQFIEAARSVTVVRCSDNHGPKEKLGRFFVGDDLVSKTLKNGLVILAKKLSNGQTTRTRYNAEYTDGDLDCGLELDFYKDKIGWFKTTDLRVKIDFTLTANMPKEFSTGTVRTQVSFSSFYSVQKNSDAGVLALNQLQMEGRRLYANHFTGEEIELKFNNY